MRPPTATPSRGESGRTQRLAPLTAAGYIDHRVSNQVDYYLKTARKQERQARWLRVLALAFGAIGTLLAALGLQIYVAATTSLVAVYTDAGRVAAVRDVRHVLQPGSRRPRLHPCVVERPPAVAGGDARDDRPARRPGRAGHAGRAHRLGREMQDAMTQFRMEDSARTASLHRHGGRNRTAAAADPAEPRPALEVGAMPSRSGTSESGAASRRGATACIRRSSSWPWACRAPGTAGEPRARSTTGRRFARQCVSSPALEVSRRPSGSVRADRDGALDPSPVAVAPAPRIRGRHGDALRGQQIGAVHELEEEVGRGRVARSGLSLDGVPKGDGPAPREYRADVLPAYIAMPLPGRRMAPYGDRARRARPARHSVGSARGDSSRPRSCPRAAG